MKIFGTCHNNSGRDFKRFLCKCQVHRFSRFVCGALWNAFKERPPYFESNVVGFVLLNTLYHSSRSLNYTGIINVPNGNGFYFYNSRYLCGIPGWRKLIKFSHSTVFTEHKEVPFTPHISAAICENLWFCWIGIKTKRINSIHSSVNTTRVAEHLLLYLLTSSSFGLKK